MGRERCLRKTATANERKGGERNRFDGEADCSACSAGWQRDHSYETVRNQNRPDSGFQSTVGSGLTIPSGPQITRQSLGSDCKTGLRLETYRCGRVPPIVQVHVRQKLEEGWGT